MSVSYKNDIASMGPEHGVIKKKIIQRRNKESLEIKSMIK